MSDDTDWTGQPKPPPNEAWWERELLRNEKLIEKYLESLGDPPSWKTWLPTDSAQHPAFGIHLPENSESDPEPGEVYSAAPDGDSEAYTESEAPAGDEPFETGCEDSDDTDVVSEDVSGGENYSEIAEKALEFAQRAFELEDLPHSTDVFHLAAGKVGAHLAGGHGLGYDEESICGNIVKCRWALADCEFCGEILAQSFEETQRSDLRAALDHCKALAACITERIERLRARVWW